MEKETDNRPSHENMAYLINHDDDPVLKHLTLIEVQRMCTGTMPERRIDGINRYISIGNDELLEKFRSKYLA